MTPIGHVVQGGKAAAWELARDLVADGIRARLVRGERMRTKRALFDECSAALQFPAYFGQNWDAFDECLSSLQEFAPGPWSVIVSDADLVLDHATAHDRRAFADCLTSAHGGGLELHFFAVGGTAACARSWPDLLGGR